MPDRQMPGWRRRLRRIFAQAMVRDIGPRQFQGNYAEDAWRAMHGSGKQPPLSPASGCPQGRPVQSTPAEVLRQHLIRLETACGKEQKRLMVEVYLDLHHLRLIGDDQYRRGMLQLQESYLTLAAFNLIPADEGFHVTWAKGHPQPDPPVGDEPPERLPHWSAATFPLHSMTLRIRAFLAKVQQSDSGCSRAQPPNG